MFKKLMAIPAVAAVASFANTGSGTTAPDWATSLSADQFDSILGEVAPIAIAVVVGVAGVRVAIKLINRGAGK